MTDQEEAESQQPTPRRQMIGAIVLLILLAPLVVVALHVDDWSRDLTTNTAATSRGADDQALRPIDSTASLQAIRAMIKAFAESDHAWTIVRSDPKPLPPDSPLAEQANLTDASTIHLVRKTGLMGFSDDVWVVLEATEGGGTWVHAESRSRVGRGDLGQNPRNLSELLSALKQTL